ncbi:MAG: glycoside hydrolase family 3 C-terminal domain-containing protein [Ignavibacteriales bacterium]|nr:glycoside hydrolase family 3 C-terminal domain-containing protein [Ignavibacteriales bacterium]
MSRVEAYLNPDLPIEQRAEDLLSRMTLPEKIAQLKARAFNFSRIFSERMEELFDGLQEIEKRSLENLVVEQVYRRKDIHETVAVSYWKKHWKELILDEEKNGIGMLSCTLRYFSPRESAAFANEIQDFLVRPDVSGRLKIPVMIHDECLHGCVAKGSTSFPQSIALASTWNPNLVEEVAAAIGKETRARGIHQALSPTINIARDPRCGRVEETYGEDPYLTSAMAVSFIEGLQSQKVVATPKHFAANFVGDGGRDSGAIHFSERILREVYFPAFKASIQQAGALSTMAAYNSLDGVPCSCNKWLLTDVLRKEWGFKGFVVSDYESVSHLQSKHKVAQTKAEAAQKALEAGLDMELDESECYDELARRCSSSLGGLASLARDGKLSVKTIDDSVRRILYVKFWLGLFDNHRVDPEYAAQVVDCEEHRQLALRAARESIVLLKNTGILPLTRDCGSIAVIGPNANEIRLGGYSGYGIKVVTPLEGIRNKVSPSSAVHFAEGCKLTGSSEEGFAEAVRIASKSSVALLFMGNSSRETEGEGIDRHSLDIPGVQEALIKAVRSTGTPVVVVLINGSAITMTKWVDEAQALIEAWYPGEEGGNAIAEVLFGHYNPGGKLPITFPKSVGQLPLYYNDTPSGRVDDYADLRGEQALFPFGHGLSYTEFVYTDLQITPQKMDARGKVAITLAVENVGKYEGDEVVQLYIHDAAAVVARPVKELKGFARITLAPGEKKAISFTLAGDDLAFYDIDMNWIIEPGFFEVMIGSSSEDIRLKGAFAVH